MECGTMILEAVRNKYEGTHIYDSANEYGEPGYSTDGVVFLGNYWCRCGKIEGLHDIASHHPRVFAAMEEAGHALEWSDEWVVDSESNKAYRTQADSYSWTPSTVFTDDGDLLTPDSDIEELIEWAINSADRALMPTLTSPSVIVEAGWSLLESDLESGWHPGQTDDPGEILKTLQSEDQWRDVLFYINGVGQFDTRFSVYVRSEETD